jgi:hypothetical protein
MVDEIAGIRFISGAHLQDSHKEKRQSRIKGYAVKQKKGGSREPPLKEVRGKSTVFNAVLFQMVQPDRFRRTINTLVMRRKNLKSYN